MAFYTNGTVFQLMNVQVPFLFKYAIDYISNLDSTALVQTAGGTVITVAAALLLGCKYNVLTVPCTLHGTNTTVITVIAALLLGCKYNIL